eukprot:Phypoly_transcript_10630.p1 GENE.Phypoly_transcript_10630~~Phypoly_transcript_10630.p1  ORF type:complete len:398 (+),score=113.63 Phypoly_transcript_10630:47-1240(+)
MFGKSKKIPTLPSAIKAMWDAEDALSLEQRRERYSCKKKFTKAEDIVRWESFKTKTSPLDTKSPVSDHKVSQVWFHKHFDLSGPNIFAKYKEDPVINSKVALWSGNITTLEIDAILNAANTSLLGGGGVDGAIHSAAGGKLYDECKLLNGCKSGEAKITRGYRLPAKYIIATVGPVGEKPEVLYNAYYNSLEVAKKYGIRTFALCGVSTGVYGYPLYAASHIALATVRKWLEKNKKHVDMIVFCTFLPRETSCYESMMPLYFPRSSVIPPRPYPTHPQEEGEEEEQEEEQEEEKGEGEGEGEGEKGEGEKQVEGAEETAEEGKQVESGESTTTSTTTTATAVQEGTKDKDKDEQEEKAKDSDKEPGKDQDGGTEEGKEKAEEDLGDLAASLANTKIE